MADRPRRTSGRRVTTFDYWVPDGLALRRGSIVRVRLGGRALIGVVVDIVATTDIPRERLQPIDRSRRRRAGAAATICSSSRRSYRRYYQEPLGLVLAQMIPPVSKSGEPPPVAAARWWRCALDQRRTLELAASVGAGRRAARRFTNPGRRRPTRS